MTYEEFKTEYKKLFNRMFEYTCDQVGSMHFAEKMADLADQYPDFESRLEDEHNQQTAAARGLDDRRENGHG